MTPELTIAVPLSQDELGGWQIGESRIPLERVINEYNRGETPEQIVSNFPALDLADVYAVIVYYLHNRSEVESYMRQREEHARRIRHDIETRFPSTELRQRLLARRPRDPQA